MLYALPTEMKPFIVTWVQHTSTWYFFLMKPLPITLCTVVAWHLLVNDEVGTWHLLPMKKGYTLTIKILSRTRLPEQARE